MSLFLNKSYIDRRVYESFVKITMSYTKNTLISEFFQTAKAVCWQFVNSLLTECFSFLEKLNYSVFNEFLV